MTTERIGSFYAPQARLIDIATGDVVGGRVGENQDRVDLDIVSARVTLVNTNVSQLTVVLNNQIFGPDGLPLAPPWKYNALDRIKFGQRVRLDLRYGDQPWTKMIIAQVNDLQFSFPSSGVAQVTVTAEDLLCLLKRKPQQDVPFEPDLDEEMILTRTIRAGLGALANIPYTVPVAETDRPNLRDGVLTVRAGLVPWPARSRGMPAVRHTKSQTYLQFIQTITERMDAEVFVDFLHNFLPDTDPGSAGTDEARPTGNESNDLVFHVEPARSLVPERTERRFVDLHWGGNLIDFTPKLKIWDLVTEVRVKGRPRHTSTPIDHTIRGDEAKAIVAEDLVDQADNTNPDTRAKTAVELRTELLGDAALPTTEDVEFTDLDEDRALIKARAVLRARTREMLTAEATLIGFSSLRAGMYVRIRGLHAPFNGYYYVTRAVHTFDGNGYRTQISVRRPGMLPPAKYPHSYVEQTRRAIERVRSAIEELLS